MVRAVELLDDVMQQRANDHVVCCEKALKNLKGIVYG